MKRTRIWIIMLIAIICYLTIYGTLREGVASTSCPSGCLAAACLTGGGADAREVTNGSCKDWCSPPNSKGKRFCMAASYLAPGGSASGTGVNTKAGAIDCTGCAGASSTPPPPPPPAAVVDKDITDRTMIDNREWINNSRYIDTYNIHDKRVQTLIQKNPVYFYKNARIDRRRPDVYPPGTYILFNNFQI